MHLVRYATGSVDTAEQRSGAHDQKVPPTTTGKGATVLNLFRYALESATVETAISSLCSELVVERQRKRHGGWHKLCNSFKSLEQETLSEGLRGAKVTKAIEKSKRKKQNNRMRNRYEIDRPSARRSHVGRDMRSAIVGAMASPPPNTQKGSATNWWPSSGSATDGTDDDFSIDDSVGERIWRDIQDAMSSSSRCDDGRTFGDSTSESSSMIADGGKSSAARTVSRPRNALLRRCGSCQSTSHSSTELSPDELTAPLQAFQPRRRRSNSWNAGCGVDATVMNEIRRLVEDGEESAVGDFDVDRAQSALDCFTNFATLDEEMNAQNEEAERRRRIDERIRGALTKTVRSLKSRGESYQALNEEEFDRPAYIRGDAKPRPKGQVFWLQAENRDGLTRANASARTIQRTNKRQNLSQLYVEANRQSIDTLTSSECETTSSDSPTMPSLVDGLDGLDVPGPSVATATGEASLETFMSNIMAEYEDRVCCGELVSAGKRSSLEKDVRRFDKGSPRVSMFKVFNWNGYGDEALLQRSNSCRQIIASSMDLMPDDRPVVRRSSSWSAGGIGSDLLDQLRELVGEDYWED